MNVLPRDNRPHRPSCEDDLVEFKLLEEGLHVAGVLTEGVPEFRLLRPTVPPEINSNRPEIVREAHQLWLKVPQTSRRPMEKDDRLSFTVLLVVEIGPVTLDDWHSYELRVASQ
jgi:hypothetical protein